MAHDLAALLTRARRALTPPDAQKAVPSRYRHINFAPPQGVREALRRGLELHEQGESGDGLQPETVAWARRLAAGESIYPEKARDMAAWFARHRAQGKPDGREPTPKLVSDLLWGGDPGQAWSGKLVEQMDAADRAEKGAPLSLAERARAALAKLRVTTPAAKEAITAADLGPGVTPPQVGADERNKFKPGVQEVKPVVVGQLSPAQGAAPEDEGPPSSLPAKLVDFAGIPVLVDRPKGFVQRKLGPDGAVLWERTYQVDYGYIAGTEGGDHEGLDVFLGFTPGACDAWWVVQLDDEGTFDEYKLLLGFESEESARTTYAAHVPEKYLGSISPMPMDRIRALLGLPHPKTAGPALKAASVLDIERLTRGAKAILGAVTYTGNTRPAEQAPPDVRAIVSAMPLSWRYSNPDAVGGWLGAIEPTDETWIAFVGVEGKVLLWTAREPAGGVIGEPFLLWRPDLARDRVELVASTKVAATPDEQFIFGIVLKPEKTDLQGEIYAHKVVRQTGHDHLAFFGNTDLQHKVFINDAVDLVESTIEKVAFWMSRDGEAWPADPTTGDPIGAPPGAQLRFVPKGSWTVAHRIKDPQLWAAIKRGEYTGYSINGLKKLAPQVAAPPAPA